MQRKDGKLSDLVKSAEPDTVLAALRERAEELEGECISAEMALRIVQAKHSEIRAAIDLVSRGGKPRVGRPPKLNKAPIPLQPAEMPPAEPRDGEAA